MHLLPKLDIQYFSCLSILSLQDQIVIHILKAYFLNQKKQRAVKLDLYQLQQSKFEQLEETRDTMWKFKKNQVDSNNSNND